MHLDERQVGDSGTRAMTRLLPGSGVTELRMRRNGLGDGALRAIARVLVSTQLSELYLTHKRIGDGGSMALAAGTSASGRPPLENAPSVGGAGVGKAYAAPAGALPPPLHSPSIVSAPPYPTTSGDSHTGASPPPGGLNATGEDVGGQLPSASDAAAAAADQQPHAAFACCQAGSGAVAA